MLTSSTASGDGSPADLASNVRRLQTEPGRSLPSNAAIAAVLDEVGELLAAQDAKPFRAQAYRRAAAAVRSFPRSVAAIANAGGAAALIRVPAIGSSLAGLIVELVESGRLSLLDRLRGHADPEALFASVPGIGAELARRIQEQLDIHTLEDLELAAHDGRLARVPGFGTRRMRGVVEALAGRLGGRAPRPPMTPDDSDVPSVTELLDVDREYLEKADAGVLRRIAPHRFNPSHRTWLPILHTERGTRHYTALFSNTARAHQLRKTNDWVVIFLDDGHAQRQATVVTETHGPLAGRRVVRGREPECQVLYRRAS